jgi:hypothetical protein
MNDNNNEAVHSTIMWSMLFLLLEGNRQILGKAHLNQRLKPSTMLHSLLVKIILVNMSLHHIIHTS